MSWQSGKTSEMISDDEYIETETIVRYCGDEIESTCYILRYFERTMFRIAYFSRPLETRDSCFETIKKLIQTYKEN